MVVVNGMGQSSATASKQGILDAIVDQHVAVVSEIAKKYAARNWHFPGYVYIDATAGCGDNVEVGVIGSPRIFHTKIQASGLPYRCHLIDREPVNTQALQKIFSNDPCVQIYCGDHRTVLRDILQTLDERPFGILYFDPNGVPDFGLIEEVCKKQAFEKVDVLIRFSATAVKRVRGAFGRRSVKESLESIGKTNWLIGVGAHGDPWQSTFAFGLNHSISKYTRTGLYSIGSVRGESILRQINYTAKERESRLPGQTNLYEFSRRVSV